MCQDYFQFVDPSTLYSYVPTYNPLLPRSARWESVCAWGGSEYADGKWVAGHIGIVKSYGYDMTHEFATYIVGLSC